MLHRILSDEEYKQCFYDICNSLPDSKVGIGSMLGERQFISITITYADALRETVHVKATFSPDDYVMSTKKPILRNEAVIAHQLLAFGITDISDFRWH